MIPGGDAFKYEPTERVFLHRESFLKWEPNADCWLEAKIPVLGVWTSEGWVQRRCQRVKLWERLHWVQVYSLAEAKVLHERVRELRHGYGRLYCVHAADLSRLAWFELGSAEMWPLRWKLHQHAHPVGEEPCADLTFVGAPWARLTLWERLTVPSAF